MSATSFVPQVVGIRAGSLTCAESVHGAHTGGQGQRPYLQREYQRGCEAVDHGVFFPDTKMLQRKPPRIQGFCSPLGSLFTGLFFSRTPPTFSERKNLFLRETFGDSIFLNSYGIEHFETDYTSLGKSRVGFFLGHFFSEGSENIEKANESEPKYPFMTVECCEMDNRMVVLRCGVSSHGNLTKQRA